MIPTKLSDETTTELQKRKDDPKFISTPEFAELLALLSVAQSNSHCQSKVQAIQDLENTGSSPWRR
jgi:hypothetical protein